MGSRRKNRLLFGDFAKAAVLPQISPKSPQLPTCFQASLWTAKALVSWSWKSIRSLKSGSTPPEPSSEMNRQVAKGAIFRLYSRSQFSNLLWVSAVSKETHRVVRENCSARVWE